MKKTLIFISLLFTPFISRAATQVYIPSTNTYQGNNSVINIASGTIRNFNASTFTVNNLVVSTTITNLNIASATISRLTVSTLTVTSSTTLTNETVNQSTITNLSLLSNLRIPDGTPASPAIQFITDPAVGIIKPNSQSIGFVTNSSTGLWQNGIQQIISTYKGTACLPSFTFSLDAGTGLFLPLSDNLAFGVGCSTAMVMHQHDYPIPLDYTIANIYTITGGSGTAAGTNSSVDVSIYTSSLTTTNNKIAECDQLGCEITIQGHDAGLTVAFTDHIQTSYFTPTVLVVSSHDDISTPSVRIYSSGGGSTGIINCKVASGIYLTQAYITALRGK